MTNINHPYKLNINTLISMEENINIEIQLRHLNGNLKLYNMIGKKQYKTMTKASYRLLLDYLMC